ncbi:hypothetical protein C0J52_05485 [Blattella germanica]|nr:hypothetical protein C0J52_05485 [Blattella germanica]
MCEIFSVLMQAIDEGVEEEEEEERKPARKKFRKRKRKDDEDVAGGNVGSSASTSGQAPVAMLLDQSHAKKRRGRPPLDKTAVSNNKVKKQMKKLMSIVVKYMDRDGRTLSGPFMKLPSKQELPDYYNIIKKPIDIKKIQQRLDENKYNSFDDLERDFIQMCRNAQKYNEELSLIHEDSIVLEKVFLNARTRLEQDTDAGGDDEEDEEEEQERPPAAEEAEESQMQPIIDEEAAHSDNDSMKVRIKLKGRKAETATSSSSGRRSLKKAKKHFSEEDDEEEEVKI